MFVEVGDVFFFFDAVRGIVSCEVLFVDVNIYISFAITSQAVARP